MSYRYIILGAGCAGLSICYHLLEQGASEPILLVDQRNDYTNDRTWCFWDVEPTPFTHLATHSWQQWTVRSDSGLATQGSNQYRYCHLPSQRFYEYVLARLRTHPNVTLQLNERVSHYVEESDQVVVTTDANTYTGCYLVDARGLSKSDKVAKAAQKNARWIPQHFVGQRLVTERAVFDPSTCQLMDFRVSQSKGLHFVYLLPYSATEALVENVYMAQAKVSRAEHLQEIQAYMQQVYALEPKDWRIIGEESGYIPMTDFRFAERQGQRISHLGMRGGQTRAASGYTFVRIQRAAHQLAAALSKKTPAERESALRAIKIEPPHYRWLDGLFLRFMETYPERCPALYQRLFARTSGNVVARFMTERSSLWDDLTIILALPILPFIHIALHALVARWVPWFASTPTGLTQLVEKSH